MENATPRPSSMPTKPDVRILDAIDDLYEAEADNYAQEHRGQPQDCLSERVKAEKKDAQDSERRDYAHQKGVPGKDFGLFRNERWDSRKRNFQWASSAGLISCARFIDIFRTRICVVAYIPHEGVYDQGVIRFIYRAD